MAWTTMFKRSEEPITQIKAYEGKLYEGKIIGGHTNVTAMEVLKNGEDRKGNGMSFPVNIWHNLPSAKRPE